MLIFIDLLKLVVDGLWILILLNNFLNLLRLRIENINCFYFEFDIYVLLEIWKFEDEVVWCFGVERCFSLIYFGGVFVFLNSIMVCFDKLYKLDWDILVIILI